jgi:hypothetical protein
MKSLTLAVALIAAAALYTPLSAAPATATQVPVVGAVTGGGTFAGTFNLTRFATQNGALVAVGTIAGTLTNAAGQTSSVVQTVSIPAAVAATTCQILHLDLGPLSLDLLGLHVDLSRIVLDITAEAGAGNLLGNLLCAVANLLNDPTGLARILNQILALL